MIALRFDNETGSAYLYVYPSLCSCRCPKNVGARIRGFFALTWSSRFNVRMALRQERTL